MKEKLNKKYYKMFLCETVESSIQTDVSIYKFKHIQKKLFNFSKFHVLVHYTDFIKKFRTSDEFNSVISETNHKNQMKKSYSCINKQNNFLVQIMCHNLC